VPSTTLPSARSLSKSRRSPSWTTVVGRSWLLDEQAAQDALLLGETAVSALHLADFPSGHRIFAEGQSADRVYVIISGIVKVTSTVNGRHVVRALLGPGDVLGELAIFDPEPRSDTATCQTLVRTAWLTTSSARRLLRRHPDLAYRWLKALAHQIRTHEAEFVITSSFDMSARVARLMVTLADRFGEHVDGMLRVHHGLTRNEFAELVGASKETVSRSLALFIDRGWVVTTRGGFDVLNEAALRSRAHLAFRDSA